MTKLLKQRSVQLIIYFVTFMKTEPTVVPYILDNNLFAGAADKRILLSIRPPSLVSQIKFNITTKLMYFDVNMLFVKNLESVNNHKLDQV